MLFPNPISIGTNIMPHVRLATEKNYLIFTSSNESLQRALLLTTERRLFFTPKRTKAPLNP